MNLLPRLLTGPGIIGGPFRALFPVADQGVRDHIAVIDQLFFRIADIRVERAASPLPAILVEPLHEPPLHDIAQGQDFFRIIPDREGEVRVPDGEPPNGQLQDFIDRIADDPDIGPVRFRELILESDP